MNINEVIQKIEDAREIYYGRGKAQELTDDQYDTLVEILKEDDPDHPLLSQIGCTPKRGTKVTLDEHMYSLAKIKTLGALEKWFPISGRYVISEKMDGCAVDLKYVKEGKKFYLVQAITRGDGETGEDVTAQIVNCVDGLPNIFESDNENEIFHAYGEIIIRRKYFNLINKSREAKGLKTFSNPRNLANASLGMEDLKTVSSRKLEFFAYNSSERNTPLITRLNKMEKTYGFQVVNRQLLWSTLLSQASNLFEVKPDLPYDIDGYVIAIDDHRKQIELGYTSHHPRWAVAFKFGDETAEVVIKEIEWTISKNGVITPQAIFDPVQLGGAEIERVTLHNAWHVESLRLAPKVIIKICRSNEVIPKFLEVLHRPIDIEIKIPQECPSCGGGTIYRAPLLACHNLECPARVSMALEHFISSIGYKGIGEAICLKLLGTRTVKTIPDLWRLSIEDFCSNLGWSIEHAEKVYQGIHEIKKDIPLDKFLVALNISGLGKVGAMKFAPHVKMTDGYSVVEGDNNCRSPYLEFDFEKAKIIFGPTMVYRVLNSLCDIINAIWKDLCELGFTIKVPIEAKKGAKKIVITGTLENPRKDYEEAIEKSGNIYQKSLGKETDFLVCGDKVGGSKITKAEKYGTKIVNELWLKEFLNNA